MTFLKPLYIIHASEDHHIIVLRLLISRNTNTLNELAVSTRTTRSNGECVQNSVGKSEGKTPWTCSSLSENNSKSDEIKERARIYIGLKWLRVGSSANAVMNRRIQEISWSTQRPPASEEGSAAWSSCYLDKHSEGQY